MDSMKITMTVFGFVLMFIMGMVLGYELASSNADEMCLSACQTSGWDVGEARDKRCVCSTVQTKEL